MPSDVSCVHPEPDLNAVYNILGPVYSVHQNSLDLFCVFLLICQLVNLSLYNGQWTAVYPFKCQFCFIGIRYLWLSTHMNITTAGTVKPPPKRKNAPGKVFIVAEYTVVYIGA